MAATTKTKDKKKPAKKAGKSPKATMTRRPVTALTKTERIQAHQQSLNTMYKAPVIQTASEFSNVFLVRRPFGIASLDLAIAGGMPAGGLTELIGASSVGKDYLVNRAVANLQAVYGEEAAVMFCMTEMHYDKKYAKKCGVRIALTDREIDEWQHALGRDFTDEEMAWAKDQVGTIQETTAANAEQLLEIAAQHIASNLYQIVVINSIGALLTKAEETAERGLEDKHYGGAAMAITGFCHKLHMALNHKDEFGQENLTTVIGINQYRDNLAQNAKYAPMKAAGGNAWKHAQLLSVGLRAGSRLKMNIKGQQQIIGKEINWEIRKQKAGGHDGAKGMYPFYYGEHGYPFGAEVYQDLIVMGVQYGIIQAAGAWLAFEDEKYQLKGQGKEKFAHEIASAEGCFEYLKDKIFAAAEINYLVQGLDEQ